MQFFSWKKSLFLGGLLLLWGIPGIKLQAASVIEIPATPSQDVIITIDPIEIVVPSIETPPAVVTPPAQNSTTQAPAQNAGNGTSKKPSTSKTPAKTEGTTKQETNKKDSTTQDSNKNQESNKTETEKTGSNKWNSSNSQETNVNKTEEEKKDTETKTETITEPEVEQIEEQPVQPEEPENFFQEKEGFLEPDNTQGNWLEEMNQMDTYNQETEDSFWLPPEEEEPVMETVEESRPIGELFQYGGINFINELSQNGMTFMIPALSILLTVLFGVIFVVMNSNARRAEEWE